MSSFRLPSARTWSAGVLLTCLGGGLPLRAEQVLYVPVQPNAEVSIRVATPCAQPPRFGFAPIHVTVDNTGDRERTWQLQFQSSTPARAPGALTLTRSISVPGRQLRELWVYVPVMEMGESAGAPTLSASGIQGGARATPPSLGTGWTVSITKTPSGTKVTRTMPLSRGTAMVEETEIDETTGELKRRRTGPNGTSNTSSSVPPPGSDVTYTIDPRTGMVSARGGRSGAGLAATKVTVIQGSVSSSPGGFQIWQTKTLTGVKISRVIPGSGSRVDETEIDEKNGVVTTTHRMGSAILGNPITTPPVANGVEATFTVNPATGTLRTDTRPGVTPSAPPNIIIVTTGVPMAPGGAASIAVGGVAPGAPTTFGSSPTTSLAVEASGPWVQPGRLQFPMLSGDGGMRPIAATPALERVVEESLKALNLRTPNLAAVEPAQLPADWRVWSSFATVMMGSDDYTALDGAHRSALRAWVATGGKLILVPRREGERKSETVGAGSIVTLASPLPEPAGAPDLVAAEISLDGGVGHPDASALAADASSLLGKAVAQPQPQFLYIGLFVIGFAALVGPVNLFLLAPAKRRHRLFFTTPLISLGGVAVLIATILIQDGIGGTGWRQAVVVLLPGANQALVVQEQGSRTGFLLGRTFPLREDTQISMLALPEWGGSGRPTVPALQNTLDAGLAGGDWFRSRSSQAQLLQQLIPTRGRVDRVGTTPAGAPIVVSSVGITLRDFVFRDDAGQLWTADALAPGAKITLVPGSRWFTEDSLNATRRFDAFLRAAVSEQGGHWLAKAGPGELAPIPTLRRITWEDADVIYTGCLETEAKRTEVAP